MKLKLFVLVGKVYLIFCREGDAACQDNPDPPEPPTPPPEPSCGNFLLEPTEVKS
jgi:hypothetical protein